MTVRGDRHNIALPAAEKTGLAIFVLITGLPYSHNLGEGQHEDIIFYCPAFSGFLNVALNCQMHVKSITPHLKGIYCNPFKP